MSSEGSALGTQPSPKPQSVSVVVVARNERDRLAGCIDSLRRQAPRRADEVILVDDGSSDDTTGMVRTAYPEVRVVSTLGVGADPARNAGLSAARGEIVAFLDADCVVPPEWIETLVTVLRESGASAAAGRVIHRGGLAARVVGVADFGAYLSNRARDATMLPTLALGLRRLDVTGISFDARAPVGGDVLFSLALRRAGLRLRYDPRLEVEHRPRTDRASLLRRAESYGRGFVWTRRAEPSLRGGAWVRAGAVGVVLITLGRTLIDWGRAVRAAAGIRHRELPAALFQLLYRRIRSLPAALSALHGEVGRR
jgi:glycosyltransferase involved in cell wall biosynthesis